MRLQTEEVPSHPGTVLVRVDGVIDSTTVEDFFRGISAIFQPDVHSLILDISGMSYISSGGLSVLQDAYKKSQARGGKVAIVGMKEQIRELFEVVGFQKVFPIYGDIDTALGSLS